MFDAEMTQQMFLHFNQSNINITLDIKNGLPLNDTFNKELTNFTWSITKAFNMTLHIQVLFLKPVSVSYGTSYDFLEVSITNKSLEILSFDNKTLSNESYSLKYMLPRQMEITEFQQTSVLMSNSISSITQATSTGSLVMGVVWTNLINELLKTYQPLQLMLHFPVMKVWFPATIMVHFKNFVPIVNFDLMGEIKAYTDLLEKMSQVPG